MWDWIRFRKVYDLRKAKTTYPMMEPSLGVVGSDEWWRRIDKKEIKVHTLEGIIGTVLLQHGSELKVNTSDTWEGANLLMFTMISTSGVTAAWSFEPQTPAVRKLQKGKQARVFYVSSEYSMEYRMRLRAIAEQIPKISENLPPMDFNKVLLQVFVGR